MSKTKDSRYLAIVMEGGVIQNICTNDDTIDVVIVDYDAFEEGNPPVWEMATELMTVPLSENTANGDDASWKEQEVANVLKQLGY